MIRTFLRIAGAPSGVTVSPSGPASPSGPVSSRVAVSPRDGFFRACRGSMAGSAPATGAPSAANNAPVDGEHTGAGRSDAAAKRASPIVSPGLSATPGVAAAAAAVRCRPITLPDLEAVGALLKKGFGRQRSRLFWRNMLNALGTRPTPAGMPQYGYLMEVGSRPVGVLLALSSTIHAGTTSFTRCNLSSWYIEPEFRPYGSLLSSRVLRHKAVTYINISPAPETWPLLEAQGYRRYSQGLFMSVPLLSAKRSTDVEMIDAAAAGTALDAVTDPFEREVLFDHLKSSCVSVWCKADGFLYPFVFTRRVVWRTVPCFQLVYCRNIKDFVRFARPLGRYLARRGRPLVLIDADAPVEGLIGRYFPDVRPKYFKGPHRPRLGDLAYTEASLFGI
jgi:hypothetical protein